MQAENVACSAAVSEAFLLWKSLQHLEVVANAPNLVTIDCDSTITLTYAKDPKYYGRTKHIDKQYHYIRDMIAKNEVVLKHISISHMIADPMAKPIMKEAFYSHVWSSGLCKLEFCY